jgi:predicted N-acyltransferase
MALDYLTRILHSAQEVSPAAWDALLSSQAHATPFFRHAYLCALESSGSACPATGWEPRYFAVYRGEALVAATVLYAKSHSYGEYVFDWAWASAYHQHGVPYYPKGVIAVPFTPVPGSRLLATDSIARDVLLQSVVGYCRSAGLSSLHILFSSAEDQQAAQAAGLMLRHTVQFHWNNTEPGYTDFDTFLQTLTQDKRKKIRQERRKVRDAGVEFSALQGQEITQADWDFFYACYERTYLEHGNAPYLSRTFFDAVASHLPDHFLLFIASRGGRRIASSLIAIDPPDATRNRPGVAYGRYWGALERVDCLHFEACYYQALEWCIAHRYARFEGGAQGEHKMARALLPVRTSSAHWIAHPAFADAVSHFLEREESGVAGYMEDLAARNPFREMVRNREPAGN